MPVVSDALADALAREAPEVDAATLSRVADFATRWHLRPGSEEQLSQQFLVELCAALGVEAPGLAPAEDYCFEKRVSAGDIRGKIDLYKKDHFILEAKCGREKGEAGSAPQRGTRAYYAYLVRAYGEQARQYAFMLPEGPPPLLIVVDVGSKFMIWRQIDGRFGGFLGPHRIDIELSDLAHPTNIATLRACFEAPALLDPSRIQERMSREAARRLATLARDLEAQHGAAAAGRIARFLMRCLFCMFAEDVELLPRGFFTAFLERAVARPERFEIEVGRLFAEMDTGGSFYFSDIRRFNGALFREPGGAGAMGLPLTAGQIAGLLEAARLNWSLVEPAIFGTLLERALDPRERHRLGAHFTPRAYVERLVRATIEKPLRQRWEALQSEIEQQLRIGEEKGEATAAVRGAEKLLRAFYRELTTLRVLDPACGTGNFLYVAYVVLKELEHEVQERLRVLLSLAQERLDLLGDAVVPEQFHGIEKKEWAAEIAQLVLWLGHLQWQIGARGVRAIAEPVLTDVRTIEHRDAVLRWADRVPVVDEAGAPVTRWDGHTTRAHPVTGKAVPDEAARVAVERYVDPTPADPWPAADFIVGNPPFIGNKHMRGVLGDDYVDALRAAWGDVPDTVDYVMYWWHRAATLLRDGRLRRFGLITTNSIKQVQNRQVITHHVAQDPPLRLVMAVPDHPWVDDVDSADVRISMTVAALVDAQRSPAQRLTVVWESADGLQVQVDAAEVPEIHPDLSAGADVTSAVKLEANAGLSFQGMNLVGKGFRVDREMVRRLGYDPDAPPPEVRPYLNAREMMQRRLDRFVIDAFDHTVESLAEAHPTLYQHLLDHVKPERDQNRRASRRERWWLFGETVGKLRDAWRGLARFIVTPETARHRVFTFLPAGTIPDHTLYAIAVDDPFVLGVLSSRVHLVWALRAGGRMGVGNDPRYNNTRCFLPFPFPDPPADLRERIATVAETLDAFRAERRAAHPALGLTVMYNLLDVWRAGTEMSERERDQHRRLATGRLDDLHRRLDALVLVAYGWDPDVDDEALLDHLVDLNAERAEEEARGRVRWLRPPAGGLPVQTTAGIGAAALAPPAQPRPWPTGSTARFEAVMAALSAMPAGGTVEAVASRFRRAQRKTVGAILEALARFGAIAEQGGVYRRLGG